MEAVIILNGTATEIAALAKELKARPENSCCPGSLYPEGTFTEGCHYYAEGIPNKDRDTAVSGYSTAVASHA